VLAIEALIIIIFKMAGNKDVLRFIGVCCCQTVVVILRAKHSHVFDCTGACRGAEFLLCCDLLCSMC
jgi:hypothetical protein